MQKHEIRLNYQQASQLVQVGRFDEALEILTEINKVKPNTETILYLMALCQARTDKKFEALELCEQLINDFDNKRAKELKDYLTVPASPLGRSKQEAQVSAPKTKEKQETPQGKEEMPEAAKPPAETNDESSEEKDSVTETDEPDTVSKDEQVGEKEPEQTDEIETGNTPDSTIEEASISEQVTEEQNEDDAPTSEQVVEGQNKEELPTEASEVEKEVSVQKQAAEPIPEKSRTGRPLWLVLLWSATLALIAAYVLYIYVLDPMLNPF